MFSAGPGNLYLTTTVILPPRERTHQHTLMHTPLLVQNAHHCAKQAWAEGRKCAKREEKFVDLDTVVPTVLSHLTLSHPHSIGLLPGQFHSILLPLPVKVPERNLVLICPTSELTLGGIVITQQIVRPPFFHQVHLGLRNLLTCTIKIPKNFPVATVHSVPTVDLAREATSSIILPD